MKRSTIIIAACAAVALTACASGGSRYSSANASRTAAPAVLFASGPIFAACQRAGRKDASRAHCGCVQAVANQSLAADDQRRGAAFFDDPHLAQTVRQSDRSTDERFWAKWREYGNQAARICT